MNKRILVVDDEVGIRKLIKVALEDSPYKVDTAESGEEGVRMQEAYRYDLIFLDLNMPGMNGIEALREIRDSDKDVPIFIITAFHKDYLEAITDIYEKGLKFSIAHKPLTIEQINSIAKETLEKSKVHRFIHNIMNL